MHRLVAASRLRSAVATACLALVALSLLGLLQVGTHQVSHGGADQAMRIGVTFSDREARYRSLSWQQAFENVLDASPAVVRIAAYWNEIEPARGQFDFSTLDWLLDQATKRHQQVLLSVGMKAPRWPEYYLPAWLKRNVQVADGADISSDEAVSAATLDFIQQVVEHVRGQAALAAWQVENEPLDVAGPHHWSIAPEFLNREVSLVRKLDPEHRPVVVNAFVETHPFAQLPSGHTDLLDRARAALAIADVLGLDVYPGRTMRVFDNEFSVRWPAWIWSSTLKQLKAVATQQGKDAWIVEGQAEPWTIQGKAPPPAWPGAIVDPSMVTSTVGRFQALGYTTVLLWGAEHWEHQRSNRDDAWWSAMEPLFASAAST